MDDGEDEEETGEGWNEVHETGRDAENEGVLMRDPFSELDALRAYQLWDEFCGHPCYGVLMAELDRLIARTRTDEDGLYAGQAIEISEQRGRRAGLQLARVYAEHERTTTRGRLDGGEAI